MNTGTLTLVSFAGNSAFYGLEVSRSFDGQYVALTAFDSTTGEQHYFICQQSAGMDFVNVIYHAGTDADEGNLVWDLYLNSGAEFLSDEEFALNLLFVTL